MQLRRYHKTNPNKPNSNPIQSQLPKRTEIGINLFTTKDYGNHRACGRRKTNPIQSQFVILKEMKFISVAEQADENEMRDSINIVRIFVVVLALAGFCQVASAGCPHFSTGVKVGTIAHSLLTEVSGIAASRHNPGVLWGHNDSGGLARLWAFDTRGTHLGTYNLSGVTARDFEDMAIGPGPIPGRDYLYVADTGNNGGLIDFTFTIYRVPEPAVSAAQLPVDVTLDDVNAILVRYPDSVRHGCETLLVDPLNGDIYLCTRDRWGDDNGVMKVYLCPAPHIPDAVITMQHVADVQLINGEMAVGGDVKSDSNSIIIRTKGNVERCLLWQRNGDPNLWQAFNNSMCVVPQIDEPQGEAICFKADGCGYYTVSEGVNQPVYYFDGNGICLRPAVAGDFNWDGNVDMNDLAILSAHWLMSCFTWHNFIGLDGFEGYNTTAELEAQWFDYTGSPIQTVETEQVYRDGQAMKIEYSGDAQITVRTDLTTPQDWRIYEEAKIQFRGLPSNKAKDIILTLTNAADDTAAAATFIDGTKGNSWTTLQITLDPLNTLLQSVRYVEVTINAEGKSGTVYFDDLEVITSEAVSVCEIPVNEDLDDNCRIGMLDFAKFSWNWME